MLRTKFSKKKKATRTKIPKNKSGIYQIKSEINGKMYIGSASNLHKRKIIHFSSLKNSYHGNIYLQNHYNKYGIKNLVFSILEFCPKEKLIEREQYWIDALNPEFNFRKRAENNLGTKRTEIQNKNNSTARKKFYATEAGMQCKENLRNFHLGKPAWNKGVSCKKETKLKISKANKGRIVSEEAKANLKIARAKRIFSKETCAKISKANKGKGGKPGKLNPFYGKHHTAETKKKLREAQLKNYILKQKFIKNENN